MSVVSIPVAVVADAATLGGVLTERKESYTAEALHDLRQNIKNATDPEKS